MKTTIPVLSALATIAACLYFTAPTSAQHTVSKLVISAKETYVVGPDNTIRVDTLVMHDRATILFNPGKYGVLEARVAIIGDKCIVSSKGKDGKRSAETAHKSTGPAPGEDGENGGNLSIALNFEKLGKLTIDTRGGDGGPGVNGVNGKTIIPERKTTHTYKDINGKQQTLTVTTPSKGTDGSDATKGGNGGHGGNLMFMYSTKSFIPVFNHSQHDSNSIIILTTGGRRGRDGVPGKGGAGASGGVLRESWDRKAFALDGRIDLINLNSNADEQNQ